MKMEKEYKISKKDLSMLEKIARIINDNDVETDNMYIFETLNNIISNIKENKEKVGN